MGPYRVRLLAFPVVLYNGGSFRIAVGIFENHKLVDRILERQTPYGWDTVMSVEHNSHTHKGDEYDPLPTV